MLGGKRWNRRGDKVIGERKRRSAIGRTTYGDIKIGDH